jgi:hypothetical protein
VRSWPNPAISAAAQTRQKAGQRSKTQVGVAAARQAHRL